MSCSTRTHVQFIDVIVYFYKFVYKLVCTFILKKTFYIPYISFQFEKNFKLV